MTIRWHLLGPVALCTLATSIGCGSDVETGAGGSAPEGGVKGTAIDVYDYPPKLIELPVPKSEWSAVGARVIDAGGDTTFPGTLDDEGNVSIPKVPQGKYWLSLATHNDDLPNEQDSLALFENTARTVALGVKRSHRAGLVEMTTSSFLNLQASLTVPFRVYSDDGNGNIQPLDDTIQLFSRSTAVVGSYFASGADPSDNPPADGATSLSGWRIDAWAVYPYSDTNVSQYTPDDDLTLLHNVTAQVDEPTQPAGSPWQSFQFDYVAESFQAAPFTLQNGGTAAVSGAFAPAPQKTLSLSYKGSAFNAALADAPAATPSAANLFCGVIMEPGAPEPAQGSAASLLELLVLANVDYGNPACDPGACDESACPTGCGTTAVATLPGDYSRDFPYGNPFGYGQELFTATLSFNTNVSYLLPEQLPNRLRGYLYVSMPAGEASGAPITPVISLPRKVEVNGKAAPVDQITTGVGETPTVTFDPPAIGTADRYYVRAVQLDDVTDTSGTDVTSRTVVSMNPLGTSVTIPKGVLKPGRHYYFQVGAASRPGFDPSKPYVYSQREAIGQTYTGIVMP